MIHLLAVCCHIVAVLVCCILSLCEWPGAWSWMCDFFLGGAACTCPKGLHRQCVFREWVPMCGTLADIWQIQGGCLSKACIFQFDGSSCKQIWGSLCEMSCLQSCDQQMTLGIATTECDVHSVSPCREGMVWCSHSECTGKVWVLTMGPVVLQWDWGLGVSYVSGFTHGRSM